MYIRIKKIKENEYAYLVHNKWIKKNNNGKKGPRQKVKGYLGRVYRFDAVKDVDFLDFISIDNPVSNVEEYIKGNSKISIIKDLVEWEIHKHNIDKNDFSIDIDNKKIIKDNKNIVIGINDGYMCAETINKLIGLRNKEEEQQGLELAKRFVQAGIKVPNEIFVGYFGKTNGL